MSDLSVRQAVWADMSELVLLYDAYRQFYGQNSDLIQARAFLQARFNHGESTVFLAFKQDKAVGFAQLYPQFSSVSMARTYLLNDLYVTQSMRKQGVASHLLAAAVQYAREMGAVRVSLSTAKDNAVAKAAYQSNGWMIDTRFDVFHFSL